jgi:hypothetical protein
MVYHEGTEQRVNVFHVRVAGAGASELPGIADAFDTHDTTYGRAMRTTECLLDRITVTNISTSSQDQYTKPITPPRPGTNGTGSTPGNVTSTVSWRGLFVGRQYRGRTYVVDTPNDAITAGETLTGSRSGILATWAVNLLAALSSVGNPLVVASFTHNAAYAVVSAVIDNILDSQRRRLPGRGR